MDVLAMRFHHLFFYAYVSWKQVERESAQRSGILKLSRPPLLAWSTKYTRPAAVAALCQPARSGGEVLHTADVLFLE